MVFDGDGEDVGVLFEVFREEGFDVGEEGSEHGAMDFGEGLLVHGREERVG